LADPQASTTIVLTEAQLAKLRREQAFWVAGALLLGVGAGYALARLTTRKVA
jgi:hypothetical protein